VIIKEIYDKKLDEKAYNIVHESGLEIYIYPKKDYTKKFAYFAAKYGALYNKFSNIKGENIQLPFGVAHFLEHKIFEDEKKNIFSEFAKLGANVNAHTNFNSTVYYFDTINKFEESLKILVDFVLTPHITDENVEKEKGIIIQEIKMYNDDPNWRAYFNGLNAMYDKHPIREDIAGDEDSVNITTKEDLLNAFNNFYSPKNMMLFLIGDFEVDSIIKNVFDILPKEYLNKKEFGKLIIEEEKDNVNKEEVTMKMDVPIPMFDMFIKGESGKLNEEFFKKSIANKIALESIFGVGSEFFNNNYESGNINDTFGCEYNYGQGYSYFAMGGESENADIVKKEILDAIEKFNKEGIDEKKYIRIKRKIIGRYIASFNSIQYIANSFINCYMKGINFFDYLNIVESITIEDINKTFDFDLKNKITISKIV